MIWSVFPIINFVIIRAWQSTDQKEQQSVIRTTSINLPAYNSVNCIGQLLFNMYWNWTDDVWAENPSQTLIVNINRSHKEIPLDLHPECTRFCIYIISKWCRQEKSKKQTMFDITLLCEVTLHWQLMVPVPDQVWVDLWEKVKIFKH